MLGVRFPLFTSKRLGVDLGTSNCLVWSAGEGLVLNEPSVVAIDSVSGKPVAVGAYAFEMLGKTGGGNFVAQKPLREGVVADYLVAEALMRYFVDKVLGSSRFARPEVMVCVPWGITQVERRAVLEATLSSGAKVAYLIEHPLAAALGAKLPIEAPTGSMIVDIGAGQAGAAVVSLGGIVVASSSKAGGDKMDEAIVTYVRRNYNLIIGERMAEDIKIKVGNALPQASKKEVEVKGRDAVMGMPKTVVMDANEITEAIGPVLNQIVACIKNVLEQTPPELASDIIDRGIVLTGGGAQLRSIDRLIANQTGVSAHLVEDPMQTVAYGAGIALENLDRWKKVLGSR